MSQLEKALHLCSDVDEGKCGLDTARLFARAAVRSERSDKHDADRAALGTLQRYDAEVGQKKVEAVQRALPCLQRQSLKCLPSEAGFDHFALVPDAVQNKATSVASYICTQPNSKVGPALSNLWAELHQTIGSDPAPSSPQPEQRPPPRPCMEAGICICSDNGLVIKRMRNKLLREMKATFSNQADKAALSAGKVLACFSKEAGDGSVSEVFLQVALLYWSPYRPTLQRVLCYRCLNPEPLAVPDAIYVEVGHGKCSAPNLDWDEGVERKEQGGLKDPANKTEG